MHNIKLYRPNVGIVLFNEDKKIWIGRRLDTNPKEEWQLPQGGIDKQETPSKAAIRELYEETGIKSIKKVSFIDKWLKYDLPKSIAKNKWKGKFVGQKQKWFLFYFYGKINEININLNNNPEFSEWKWAEEEFIKKNVTEFRKDIYQEVFQIFSKIIKDYT